MPPAPGPDGSRARQDRGGTQARGLSTGRDAGVSREGRSRARSLAVDASALAGIAAAPSGLFTRVQARSCGYSPCQVRRRLGTGEWVRVLGPVLAPAATRISVRARDVAATLAM